MARDHENPFMDDDGDLRQGVVEYAVQIAKTPSGRMVARVVKRTRTYTTVVDVRSPEGRCLSLTDLAGLDSTLFDGLCREATILGGIQLSL